MIGQVRESENLLIALQRRRLEARKAVKKKETGSTWLLSPSEPSKTSTEINVTVEVDI